MLLLATILVGACAAQMSESEKQEASQPHYDIGLGALAENNTSKAIAELKEAVVISPNNPRYQHALGNAYLRANQPEQAVQAFRIAVELDSRFSDAYNDLGAAYLRQQQWDSAIDAFRKALANPRYLNPERAYMNLGNLYMMQRQYLLAAEQFRKVVDVLPQSPDGYFLLGRALAEQGKAIKLDGSIAIFHLEMGIVQIREGDKAGAQESLRRAIELSPSGPEATEARRRLQGLN
jgi:Tfp pilus assembly protein PilF